MRWSRAVCALCLLTLLLAASANSQKRAATCAHCADWNRPQAPFRVFGNTYYVGTHALSSVLITSDSGHVLIDGDLQESVQQIVDNMHSLGFRIQEVKVILNSHVHFDHAGGIAQLQRLSGARVVASPWSAGVLRRGGVGKGDPQHGTVQPIARVNNVSEFRDGESLRVGDIVITPHLTAGHTPGGTSWTWQSCEGTVCRNMVYADSLNPISAPGFRFSDGHEYPGATGDFEKSFSFFETVPCDVLITAHPELSGLWDRLAARERNAMPDPLLDPGACRRYADSGREKLRQRLADEQRTR